MKIKFQLNELERPIIPLLLQLKGNRHFTLNNPPSNISGGGLGSG